MKDNQLTPQELQVLCLQQKETLIRQEVQIWDLEEEIRVLNKHIDDLQEELDKRQEKIDKFELWCDHQQTLLNAKDIERINADREAEKSITYLRSQNENLESRCQELQDWADHLQGIMDQQQAQVERMEKRFGIFYKVYRKVKNILSK